MNNELNDIAEAFGAISQSFDYKGIGHPTTTGFHAVVSGSSFRDTVDHCDCTGLVCDIGHIVTPSKCEGGPVEL